MKVNLTRIVGAIGLAAVVSAMPLVAASAAPAPVDRAPQIAAMTDYRWDWSDGSNAHYRTFAQSAYGNQARLPHLIVTQYPSGPSHQVYLQYYQHGSWHTDTTVFTNGAGRATLDFDPYCSDGSWCDGTYSYRVRVAGLSERFKIHFTSN